MEGNMYDICIVCLCGQVGLQHSARYRYCWQTMLDSFLAAAGLHIKVRTNSVRALRLILGQALTRVR